MSHDKIRAAARKRMAQMGESYAAARRAVVTEHQAAAGQLPPSDPGYVLRMSGEIHDWLTDLRSSDPPAAVRVGLALAELMSAGASLGAPLVVFPADSLRPADPREALDRSYQQSLDRLQVLRRGAADAATLVKDIQDLVTELESAQPELADLHRRALDAGRPQEAAQEAGKLAAARQQAAELRRLLPGVIEARHRLGAQSQRLQARADAFRVRKEVLKASYTAASLLAETIAAAGLAGADGGQQENSAEAISEAEARLADVTAEMERELAHEAWPEGLMELRPGAPGDSDIRILFAVEPPGTALLIAVLEGLEAVPDQYRQAVMLSADMLRRVRAGQAPEAAAHAYHDQRSVLAEFHPE